jgi:hypothetical protein
MLTLNPADLPSTFRAADDAALRGQRSAVRWRKAQLVLLLVAAGAGIVPRDSSGFQLASTIAIVAFAFALVYELARASSVPEGTWYRGRAGAESIKTVSWKYAVGGLPFPIGESRADQRYVDTLAGIVRALSDVDWSLGGQEQTTQITDGLRNLRSSPLEDRIAVYRRDRIADQRRWYHSKAVAARRGSRQFSLLVTVATAIGLGAALAQLLGAGDLGIAGVAASAAAAAAAWTQFRQHDAIASAYAVAARELTLADESLATCQDEKLWATLVEESEAAISREHTMWAAKRDISLAE